MGAVPRVKGKLEDSSHTVREWAGISGGSSSETTGFTDNSGT